MKKALLGPNFIEFRSARGGIQTPNLLIRSHCLSTDYQYTYTMIIILHSLSLVGETVIHGTFQSELWQAKRDYIQSL